MKKPAYCQFCLYEGLIGCNTTEVCRNGSNFEPAVSPEKFSKEMIHLKTHYEHDPEVCHQRMDDLMCDTFRHLGFGHGAKVFEDTEKWYA